jgi:toxin-antitoxin system PIN domain toxin
LNASACLFDSSVWLALAFSAHPHHATARRTFAVADSAHPAAFCRATQQTFLRLVTTAAVQQLFASPVISNDEAWKKWELLMKLPQVVWLDEPKGLGTLWQKYARLSSASPKVWMDAYLAAFARGHDIALATLDKDFAKFTGVSVNYLLASIRP